ncbi:hypothetical protein PQS31_03685 [Luteimonas sp BLCC-B24]|uniref:hypothetical protein n=1 Tax=Luteimonas sp. BLCC-B24 TaxID=3025317 RepID=UPI00234C9BF1|nr:hypothetical protein [Luteimonas sp. BLCC-B24]MDC7805923.1 hypothetical protein [Luteimonas sp. BLCC-B24]
MSLVYDALRQQSGAAAAVHPRAATAWPAWWHRARPHGRGTVVLMAGALLAAPAYFLGGQHGSQGVVHAAATTIAVPAAAERPLPIVDLTRTVDTAPPAVPRAAAGSASPGVSSASAPAALDAAHVSPPEADAVTAPVDVVATPVTAFADAGTAPAPAPAAVDIAPAAHAVAAAMPAPEPVRIKVEQRSAAPAGGNAAPGSDEVAIQRAIDAIGAAVAAGDRAGADRALASLEALLPSQSLTLLRMQAWIAHDGGAMDAAERLYRQIIERVPDDEVAGVNVALLDAGRGDVDDARQRLKRLGGQHARSALVARALAQVDALR